MPTPPPASSCSRGNSVTAAGEDHDAKKEIVQQEDRQDSERRNSARPSAFCTTPNSNYAAATHSLPTSEDHVAGSESALVSRSHDASYQAPNSPPESPSRSPGSQHGQQHDPSLVSATLLTSGENVPPSLIGVDSFPATQTCPQPCQLTQNPSRASHHLRRRSSLTNTRSPTPPATPSTSTTSSHALASDRLHATHEAFLSFLGSCIGLHIHAGNTMELLVTTQQSVLACQALLNVVSDIWERDFRREDVIDVSKLTLHTRLANLVNATREIFEAAQAAGDDGIFTLPEQGKRLTNAATECVRAAGECVVKTRPALERTGDFTVDFNPKYSSRPRTPQEISPISPHTKSDSNESNSSNTSQSSNHSSSYASRLRRTRSTSRNMASSSPARGRAESISYQRSPPAKPLPATPPRQRPLPPNASSSISVAPTSNPSSYANSSSRDHFLSQSRSSSNLKTPSPTTITTSSTSPRPRAAVARPPIPRSASAVSLAEQNNRKTNSHTRDLSENMGIAQSVPIPSLNSLGRTSTISRRSSKTGLRRAGTRAVRTDIEPSHLPTLAASPVDAEHPVSARPATAVPFVEDDDRALERPPTAPLSSTSNFDGADRSFTGLLTLNVDIPRTSFIDLSGTSSSNPNSDDTYRQPPSYLDQLKVPEWPSSIQNTPDTAMIPPSAATPFESICRESISGPAELPIIPVRYSDGSNAESHVSTRAPTPDQTSRKTSDESLHTTASSVDEESDESGNAWKTLTFKDDQVTGGSFSALVELLTPHDGTPDAEFVTTFFMTFRLFSTPVNFAQALIKRYNDAASNAATMEPTRLRVCNILKGWLEFNWDRSVDGDALEHISSFVEGTLRSEMPHFSGRLLELTWDIKKLQNSPSRTHSPQNSQVNFSRPRALSEASTAPEAAPPVSIISKSQLTLLKNLKNGISPCTILDLDAEELARQLTIMQSKIFCAIKPEELLGQEWMKQSNSKAVNVKAMIAFSTELSNLVGDTILMPEDAKKRYAFLKQWIKIGECCFYLKNYDALMAIMMGLNANAVQRLTKTWELVSKHTESRLDMIQTAISRGKDNYAFMRQDIKNRVGACMPCLPFLGIYLSDLAFINAGNPPKRNVSVDGRAQSIVNFDRYTKTARVIDELQSCQVSYKFRAIPEMQEWMQARFVLVRNDDVVQKLHRRSLLVEPTGHSKNEANSSSNTQAKEHGGNGNKFEFWSGLGLFVGKEKMQDKEKNTGV